MKWGVRKAAKYTSKANTARRELSELRGYDKNPSKLGSTKISTAIRRNQMNSLEKKVDKYQGKADKINAGFTKKALNKYSSAGFYKGMADYNRAKGAEAAKSHSGYDVAKQQEENYNDYRRSQYLGDGGNAIYKTVRGR